MVGYPPFKNDVHFFDVLLQVDDGSGVSFALTNGGSRITFPESNPGAPIMPPPGRPPLRRHPNLRCHPNLRLRLRLRPVFLLRLRISLSLSLSLAALACPSLTSFAACGRRGTQTLVLRDACAAAPHLRVARRQCIDER